MPEPGEVDQVIVVAMTDKPQKKILLSHLHKVQQSGDRNVKGVLQANLQHEAPKSALAPTSNLQTGKQEGTYHLYIHPPLARI